MASQPKVVGPKVVADIGGLSIGVASASISYGVGMFARADVVLAPGNAAQAFRFKQLMQGLAKAEELAGKNGSVRMECDGTSLVKGFVVPPGFAAGRGASPGYAIGVVDSSARIADINMGVYSLENTIFQAGTSDKNQGYIAGWGKCKDFKAMALFVARKLVAGFKDKAPDPNTTVLKNVVNNANKAPLEILYKFLAALDLGGYDLPAVLKKWGSDSMLSTLRNIYTREADSFESNLSTLCDAFGLVWYSNLGSTPLSGKSIGLLAREATQGGTQLEYAPVHVRRMPESYSTATGLSPTNTVLRVKAVEDFFTTGMQLSNPILGMFPASLGENPVLNKASAPMWLPDNSGYKIESLPGTQKLSASGASKGKQAKKKKRVSRTAAIQKVCSDWALLQHIDATLARRSLVATFPLMLDVKAGEVYRYGEGESSVGGVAWKVTHSLAAQEREAGTTIEFRMS